MSSQDVVTHVKEWVRIDNTIKSHNTEIKTLRERRNKLTAKIDQHFQAQNQDAVTIEITDGKLKYGETKSIQPITLKLVEQCLNDVLRDETTVHKCMTEIRDRRSVKYTRDIKRTYKCKDDE